jgi:hypothetical protein
MTGFFSPSIRNGFFSILLGENNPPNKTRGFNGSAKRRTLRKRDSGEMQDELVGG